MYDNLSYSIEIVDYCDVILSYILVLLQYATCYVYYDVHCFNFVGYLLLKLDDIINCVVSYMMPVPTVALLDGHKFLLPARCRFLLSDISYITQLLSGKLELYAVLLLFFCFNSIVINT